MAENFADRLAESCQLKKSITCVGLDPRPENLPESLLKGKSNSDIVAATEKFCLGIIESVCDIVPVVKPNIAFFEALGTEGVNAYSRICKNAQDNGLLVIGDVKRGDIGTTAECYSRGLLGKGGEALLSNHDAITINAYLGSDGIKPFIKMAKENGQGLFLLVKTSNPSSSELQDLKLADNRTVSEAMADLVNNWAEEVVGESGYSSVGAVVGATHGEELFKFRKLMPKCPFLLPGYGAQGAGADDIVGAFSSGGRGGVVNASRSIIFAYKKENTDDYAAAARKAAIAMNEDLSAALEKTGNGF